MKKIESYKEQITNFVHKKMKFFNTNGFSKFIVCTIIGLLMFIPVYISAGFYFLFGPVGFWQLLAFFGLCIFFLGVIQLGCLMFGIFLILSIIVEV